MFCSDKKLLSLTMKGEIERFLHFLLKHFLVFIREWVVDSQIRYLKVLGGASGREAMLAGLKNGLVNENDFITFCCILLSFFLDFKILLK